MKATHQQDARSAGSDCLTAVVKNAPAASESHAAKAGKPEPSCAHQKIIPDQLREAGQCRRQDLKWGDGTRQQWGGESRMLQQQGKGRV